MLMNEIVSHMLDTERFRKDTRSKEIDRETFANIDTFWTRRDIFVYYNIL